jgi:hypothetical protein
LEGGVDFVDGSVWSHDTCGFLAQVSSTPASF